MMCCYLNVQFQGQRVKSPFSNNQRQCKKGSTAEENHDHLYTACKQETVHC